MLIYTNNFKIIWYTTLSNSTIINSLKNQNEKQNSPFLTVDHFRPNNKYGAHKWRTDAKQICF